jgi:hypothetical protein
MTNLTTTVISDDATIARACERFLNLRNELPQNAVAEINDVLEHLPIDPRSATPSQAWRAMWDKPLYANTKVATGKRWVAELEPFMDNAWETWGVDPEQLVITRTGSGRDAGSFDIVGEQAQKVRSATGTSVHRLYAIQNAAGLLRGLAAQSDTPVMKFWTEPLDTLVLDLRRKLGWGWGPITVLHMLTDFGVACKPDLHVMRSLRQLGIWLSPRDQPTDAEAKVVNDAIRQMVLKTGELTPKRLRRIDIELMALSRYGIIPLR